MIQTLLFHQDSNTGTELITFSFINQYCSESSNFLMTIFVEYIDSVVLEKHQLEHRDFSQLLAFCNARNIIISTQRIKPVYSKYITSSKDVRERDFEARSMFSSYDKKGTGVTRKLSKLFCRPLVFLNHPNSGTRNRINRFLNANSL